MIRKEIFLALVAVFLFPYILLQASLRGDFDYYDIWMIREEFFPSGKKGGYEQHLEVAAYDNEDEGKNWPCYIVEDLDEARYIYLYPMKSYGSLDSYFAHKRVNPYLNESTPITYAINTLLKRFAQGSYLPDGSYDDWGLTPYLNYWVVSLLYDGEREFEGHLKKLASAYAESGSNLCFRSWRVTFGTDLPKYVVVIYAKSEKELTENRKKLELVTPVSRQVIRSIYEVRGLLRSE